MSFNISRHLSNVVVISVRPAVDFSAHSVKSASPKGLPLYTTLPHNLIKDKLADLIERIFQRECSLYIACNGRNALFTSDAVRNYNLWSCQKVCEALTFLLDTIYIRFGSKLYRQIVGIPMGTNCAPLVADLFFF